MRYFSRNGKLVSEIEAAKLDGHTEQEPEPAIEVSESSDTQDVPDHLRKSAAEYIDRINAEAVDIINKAEARATAIVTEAEGKATAIVAEARKTALAQSDAVKLAPVGG